MKSTMKLAFTILTTLILVFASTTIFLLVNQEACEGDDREEKVTVDFLTDKTSYASGEDITFTLVNNGTEGLEYDTELRETLQIFDSIGGVVFALPYIHTGGETIIQPGENLSWTWNQTYYLYIWEENREYPTWDYRSWTQVPTPERYTARIIFRDLEMELDFSIGT